MTRNGPHILTKEKLVQMVQPSFLSLGDTALVLNGILNVIQHHLQTPGNRLILRGFGVLYTTVQEAHVGRNPKRGVKVWIPRRRRLNLKPSENFFRLAWQGRDSE